MENGIGEKNDSGLNKYLSPAGAWAISLGTSIGWGSFVITGNTYLAGAGPLGSILGLIIGAVVMVVIGRNYHFMMQKYPDAGGVYTYSKNTFGFDYGFLTAWFLGLTYISMFWANVTSLPIFARYFIGDIFCTGFHYSIFGYDIYGGEVFLSVAAIILAALFCSGSKKSVEIAMIGLALIFCAGITICFLAAVFNIGGDLSVLEPAYIPDKNTVYQVLRIASISPWAFVGFENISNCVEEFKFHEKKTFSILNISIFTTTLLYIFVIILSISTYPPEYGNWLDYISDLGRLTGIKALPPFYAADHYLGSTGVFILAITLLALVLTSLIGNITALSRLIYAVARDNVMPERFSRLNKAGVPSATILLIAVISIVVPFMGRVAIGWIVDVTTLGATIIYGMVSGAAFSIARKEGRGAELLTGLAGIVMMLFFAVMLLAPNLFTTHGTMAPESYFLFAVWGILGILIFRNILHNDHSNRRFGKTGMVWTVLLMLILLTSQEWLKESASRTAERSIDHIIHYYGLNAEDRVTGEIKDAFILSELDSLKSFTTYGSIMMVFLFGLSVWIIMSNYSMMSKRELEREKELNATKTMAYTDPLTGVKSKTAFAETESLYNTRIKNGSAEDFAVVICDVNGLKQVNDTMGHKAGDELIKSACRTVCGFFKHSPVFRIGGDEFIAILTGQDYDAREHIMGEFAKQMKWNKKTMDVVIAAGLSDFDPSKDKAFHDVFERADALMYIMKKELKASPDQPSPSGGMLTGDEG